MARMNVAGTARQAFLTGACALMLALSVTSAWAVVSDYQSLAVVPEGVTLAGRDLGGMNDAQVRTVIEQAISTPMMQPLTVTGENRPWLLDPQGILTIDVDAMAEQTYAPARNATLVARLASRFAGQPLGAEVTPVFSVATSTLEAWVARAASVIDRKAIDAKRSVVRHAIHITPAVYGTKVDQAAAVTQLSQALIDDAALSSARAVAPLPVGTVRPKVLESSFKMAIVVSLSECRVRLYEGTRLIRSYACAPGQAAWPTPTGDFTIVRKQVDAPWINPHSAWSMSMPDVIPGGPGNPMGDRKIAIDYPGVFLHGIPPGEYGSIGSHASHGCIRMMPGSIHDLFGRVGIGDPVFIRQ